MHESGAQGRNPVGKHARQASARSVDVRAARRRRSATLRYHHSLVRADLWSRFVSMFETER
ncbi:MAG: hypothetical protein Q7V62_16935, partial [Actinomycetota bacterium]|nr:hypothetical protein [Actinomycetota bacterium]